MPAEEWALAASVAFSGLASGLLWMVTLITDRMLGAMNSGDFRKFQGGVPSGREEVLVQPGLVARDRIAPIVSLVLLWDDLGSTSFVLTAIGLGVVIVGVYIVSNVWKEPPYDVILAWEALLADWEATRRRYFTINLDPTRGDLGSVRAISRGSVLPLGGPAARRA
jgi:hypothetical protein